MHLEDRTYINTHQKSSMSVGEFQTNVYISKKVQEKDSFFDFIVISKQMDSKKDLIPDPL